MNSPVLARLWSSVSGSEVLFRVLLEAALLPVCLSGAVIAAGASPAGTPPVALAPPAAQVQSAALSGEQQVLADAGRAYVLEPGDAVEIRVYDIPELNQTVQVRPDGKISLLLLNDVQASGLTADQLATALSGAYARYYRQPRVTAMVQNFSAMSIYVGGQVGKPGLIPLHGTLTALQAVIEAGGLTETSQAKSLEILRHLGSGGTQVIHLNVDEILADKTEDVVLQPSDVVYVPKSNISVYVGGEVAHPGLLPLNGELTATAAIFQAGGFRETARTNMVLLLRNSGKDSPTIIKLRLDDVLKGKTDMVLQPFDIVYVPKSRIGKIDKFIDQYIRQPNPFMLNGGFSYIWGSTATVVH